MTRIRRLAIAAAGAAALTLLTAQLAVGKTAGEVVDDSTIATSTKTSLASADLGSAGAINVEVHKGIVQLAGFVGSSNDHTTALATAQGVAGVTQVQDAMVVMEGKRSAGQTLDDTTLQTRLKGSLTDKLGVDQAVAINTEVRKGQVILSGFVDNEQIRSSAGDVARQISGVTKVHNYLSVKQ